jgi:hypothetical protein
MISSSALRRMIIEEYENIKRDDDSLIVQTDLDEEELGGGYSTEFNTIPETRFFSKKTIRSIIESEIQNLNEGFIENTGANLIHTAVDGVAEYGETIAVGIPTAGAGAPAGLAAGVATKTVIDGLIAAKHVSNAVALFEFLQKNFKVVGEIFVHASNLKNYANDLDKFYKENLKILKKANKAFGKSLGTGGKNFFTEMSEALEKTIKESINSIAECVRPLIPDTAIAGTVVQFINGFGSLLNDNCFTALKSIRTMLGSYVDFFFNPAVIVSYVEKAIPAVIELFGKLAQKIEESGITGLVVMGASKFVAPAALREAASIIKNQKDNILSVIKTTASIIIPYFISSIATYQSLMKKDYLEKDEDTETPPEDKAPTEKNATQAEPPVGPTAPSSASAPVPEIAEMRNEINRLQKKMRLISERKNRSRRKQFQYT